MQLLKIYNVKISTDVFEHMTTFIFPLNMIMIRIINYIKIIIKICFY